MHFRLLLIIFCLFVFEPSNVFGFAPAGPPTLTADGYRNGGDVVINGTVSDENADSVVIKIEFEGGSFTIPTAIENGKFSIQVSIPIFIDEVTVVATDDEQLTDTEIVDI